MVTCEADDNHHNCIGLRGNVMYYEYDCGSGQSFPDDPMIGVVLENGVEEEFWKEELVPVDR